MKVLVVGATGFIGTRLVDALRAHGHVVVTAARRGADVDVDFTRDHAAETWRPRLAQCDVVVNAAGIFRESAMQRFDALHRAAPIALFEACAREGVARVVQVSALGADDAARSAYHRSKRDADRALCALPLSSAIVQPSLVYGPGGTSASLFGTLASLPLIPVPGRGEQAIQPVHVDDLVRALVVLAEARPGPGCETVPVVGPQPLTLRSWLHALRTSLGLPPTHGLPVPMPLVRIAARIGQRLPGVLLDPAALDMLERGSVADPGPITRLLGRPPRGAHDFVAPADARGERALARLGWIVPMLRASLAVTWFAAAFVSLAVWPRQDSLALLVHTGVPPALAPLALWGASLLDLAFGVLTLSPWAGRRLWFAQAALIAVYSVAIALRLPAFWTHPFGPMVKNLPILAILATLGALDPPDPPRRT